MKLIYPSGWRKVLEGCKNMYDKYNASISGQSNTYDGTIKDRDRIMQPIRIGTPTLLRQNLTNRLIPESETFPISEAHSFWIWKRFRSGLNWALVTCLNKPLVSSLWDLSVQCYWRQVWLIQPILIPLPLYFICRKWFQTFRIKLLHCVSSAKSCSVCYVVVMPTLECK
jgi:hypothetical protein